MTASPATAHKEQSTKPLPPAEKPYAGNADVLAEERTMDLPQQLPATPTPPQANSTKTEPKPVECNLCHRKFKNIPALNGHMRLHGGYFKKDSDAKKCDKRETPGPPLQTASIGVRALIEEKIISKRSKDLKVSSIFLYILLTTAHFNPFYAHICISCLQGAFLVPAPPLTTRRSPDTESFVMTPKLAAAIVAGVHSNGSGSSAATSTSAVSRTQLVKQQITTQTIHIPISTGSGGSGSLGTTTTKSIILGDSKDATLIELLKRGTKVAVKRSLSDPQQILLTTHSGSMLPTPGQRTLNAILQNAKAISAGDTSKLLQAALRSPSVHGGTDPTSPLTLSIEVSKGGHFGDSDDTGVFSDTYRDSGKASEFFTDDEVYSGVSDASMLLQAVDSAQLLSDSVSTQEDMTSLSGFDIQNSSVSLNEEESIPFSTSTQLQAVLNSPLPDSLAEFSTLHSKEYVLYDSPTCATGGSPLPSPLAYPTPPASHEAVAQSSPFLEDSHHFTDTNNPFFGGESDEHNGGSFLENNSIKSGALIRDLKGDDLFGDSKAMRQIFKDTDDSDARLQDLSFLDEPQSFLDDDNRHVSSALSAAFFSSTMTSAEEVKEALQEVLPNEAGPTDGGASVADTEIDLYYLPIQPIQSHMMSNSDDPLLSSSPKDFGGRPPHTTARQEFPSFPSPSPSKRPRVEHGSLDPSIRPLSVRTTTDNPIIRHCEELLSPSSISSSSTSSPRQVALIGAHRKRTQRKHTTPKPYEHFKSRLKEACLEDSPNCYTPAPILNPIRNGTGIYFCLLKDRPHVTDDVESVPHLRVPQINVGPKHQANIPEYSPFEVLTDDDDEAQDACIWSPEVISAEEQGTPLQRYIELAKSSAMPMGSHCEEVALKALLDCHGEFQSAILDLLQAPSAPSNQQWTPAEMSLFISGLDKWQKDFCSIAKMVSLAGWRE